MSIDISVSSGKSGFLQPFRVSKNFTALWLGQSLASLGSAILNVVLPIIALSLHGNALTLGFLMTLWILPQVMLLPFTGMLADRLPQVALMIGTDVVRFGLLIVITILTAVHELTLLELDVFVVFFGSMQALFQPAYASARAQIFTEDIRNAATSLTQGTQQLAMLVGPSIGGLIIGFSSGAVALGVDALGFLASVVSLFFVTLPTRVKPKVKKEDSHILREFGQELLGGYRELRRHAWLWVTILAFAFLNISGAGITSVLLPWLIKVELHMPSYAYGIVSSAGGMGAVLMSIVFGHRKTWKRRGLLAYAGIGLQAAALGCLVFVQWLPLIALFIGLSGIGMMLFGLIWEVSLQELVPVEAYGRVSSLDLFGSYGLLPIGYVLTGWLAQTIGGIHTIAIESALMMLVVLVALLIPSIRNFE